MEEEAASEPIVTPAVRICHQYAFTDYSEVIQPPLSVLHAALLSVPYRADDPHQNEMNPGSEVLSSLKKGGLIVFRTWIRWGI